MSDILNHFYCGRAVAEDLSAAGTIEEAILHHYPAYRLGTQGPDFLYYSVATIGSSRARKLAKAIHTSHVCNFYYEGYRYALDLIEQGHRTDGQIVLAYLAGFTTHYCLDTLTHPLIFYRTGRYMGTRATRVFSYYHKAYEVLLDAAMVSYFHNIKPGMVTPQKVFSLGRRDKEVLSEFLHYIAKKVYDIDFSAREFRNALMQAREINRHTMDIGGVKRRLLSVVERLLHQELLLTRMLIPYSSEFQTVLNLGNETWYDPTTREPHSESYPQLFQEAVNKSVEILKNVSEMIQKKNFTFDDILALYKNNSYLTGLSCDKSENFNYFNLIFKNSKDIHSYCA